MKIIINGNVYINGTTPAVEKLDVEQNKDYIFGTNCRSRFFSWGTVEGGCNIGMQDVERTTPNTSELCNFDLGLTRDEAKELLDFLLTLGLDK